MFGSNTNRAFLKNQVVMFEFWNSINKLMCCVEAFIGWVAEALVPQHLFGLCADGIDVGCISNHSIDGEGRVVVRK